jgi:hypothetical protein
MMIVLYNAWTSAVPSVRIVDVQDTVVVVPSHAYCAPFVPVYDPRSDASDAGVLVGKTVVRSGHPKVLRHGVEMG